MLSRPIFLTISVLFWVWGPASTPAFAEDFQSPRTMALGGAGHAGPLLNDCIYMNPSFGAFMPAYSIAGSYEGSAAGRMGNVSIQDSHLDFLQLGVGYTAKETSNVVDIGASKAVIKRIGLGIGSKIVISNRNLPLAYDLDAGLTGIVTDWFYATFVADNLLESTILNYGLYRQFTLGTKFNIMGILLIYVDPHLIPDQVGTTLPLGLGGEAGIELFPFADLALRGGIFRNSWIPYEDVYGDGFSFGLGWIGPRFSLDFAMQFPVAPLPTIATSVGFSIYF